MRSPSFNTEDTEDAQRTYKIYGSCVSLFVKNILCESSGASVTSVLKLGDLLPTSETSKRPRALL